MLQIVWKSLLHTTYVTDCLEIPLTYDTCYRLFGDPSYIWCMLQIVWRSLLHMMYVTDCLEIPLTYHVCYWLFGNPSYIPRMLQIVWRSLLHTTYVTDCLEIPLTYYIQDYFIISPEKLLQIVWKSLLHTTFKITLLSHQRNCYRLFGNPSYIPHLRLLYYLIREIVTDCLEIPLTFHICYSFFGNPSSINRLFCYSPSNHTNSAQRQCTCMYQQSVQMFKSLL